jgi:DNA polymerase I-like protein with 3'-5' exonuclease and polymerase domains
MIINVDVKSLEVVVAAWLSRDKILYKELNAKLDLHSLNQVAFGLPEGPDGRLVAKVLLFRILYGGNEYSFANDPDFAAVSTSQKYWKKVIEKFYNKYSGIAAWHEALIREVSKNSKLTSPFGRTYTWDLNKYGEYKLPVTQIKNYIVQGSGADIVAIARVSLYRRWKVSGIEGVLVNTIHDSLVLDVPNKSVEPTKELIVQVFKDLPTNINRIFNVNFDLLINVEIQTGINMYDLQ